MALPKLTLVLGGAASGKSAFAEGLAKAGGQPATYIATAQAFDDEMAQKIARHKAQRGAGWHTIEEPLDLPRALAQAPKGQPILIDCATLWLTNVILGDHDLLQHQQDALAAIASAPGPVVIVSNEVGYGLVPENALSRRSRNAQGRLNQDLARRADLVVTIMAGLPLVLKGSLP